MDPTTGKICVGRPDGSGGGVGFESADESVAENVDVGASGSVSVDFDVVVSEGVDATASELSVTNVNCELTDGVTDRENDVETDVKLSENELVIVGRLMTVPLDETVVLGLLLTVVRFPLMVVEMLSLKVEDELPGASVIVELPLEIVDEVPFPGADVIVLGSEDVVEDDEGKQRPKKQIVDDELSDEEPDCDADCDPETGGDVIVADSDCEPLTGGEVMEADAELEDEVAPGIQRRPPTPKRQVLEELSD